MWTNGELKKTGKAAFLANYWRSVGAALILWLLVGGFSASQSGKDKYEQAVNHSGKLSSVLIMVLLVALVGSIVVGLLIKIFIYNPLQVGCYAFFKENVTRPGASLDTILSGFSEYGRIFLTLLLRDVYIILWCLLLIIPGLVKAYSYRMVPYIIKDEPELSPTEAIARSRQMMDGWKWQAFMLDLSFIGWFLLGVLTGGILLIFWTNPYKENTDAALYLALRDQR